MYEKNKIGVGILTKNNQKGFENLICSLPSYVTPYICYNNTSYKGDKNYNHHIYSKDICNAWCKNTLLRMMINDKCEHLFLLNDNIGIINNEVFNLYIKAAAKSGLWNLCFNESQEPKNSIQYDDISISFHKELKNSFVYFHRGIIKNIGFYDERYIHNYLEQADITYRIFLKKLLPGWQWFPDVENSKDLLSCSGIPQPPKSQNEYYEKMWFNFKNKTDYNIIPVTSESDVIKNLENIKEQYSK